MKLCSVLVRSRVLSVLLFSVFLSACNGNNSIEVTSSKEVVTDNLVNPYSMSFDGENVGYVTTSVGLMKFFLDASALPELVYPLEEGSPSGVLSLNSKVYLLDNTSQNLHQLDQGISFEGIFSGELNDPVSLTTDGTYIYVTDFDLGGDNSKIYRIDNSGNKEIYLDSDVAVGASGITYSERNKSLVYTDFLNGRLMTVDIDKKQTLIAEGLGSPVDVIEYRHGYLVADFGGFEGGKGRLLYVNRYTGLVTELLTGLNSIVGLKEHNGKVYYSDMLAGKLIEVNFN